jgi:putative transposase
MVSPPDANDAGSLTLSQGETHGGWGLVSAGHWGRAGLMAAVVPSDKGFRYPAEVISHCVWLYHRFPLSFRAVEEMMMERGVVVSYETIRQWYQKLGHYLIPRSVLSRSR